MMNLVKKSLQFALLWSVTYTLAGIPLKLHPAEKWLLVFAMGFALTFLLHFLFYFLLALFSGELISKRQ